MYQISPKLATNLIFVIQRQVYAAKASSDKYMLLKRPATDDCSPSLWKPINSAEQNFQLVNWCFGLTIRQKCSMMLTTERAMV
jgi:hypothetical protein